MKPQIQMVSSHLTKAGSNQTEKQQQTKWKGKSGEKQSTKHAAMWAKQPGKSDLLWILLELKERSSQADVFPCS